MKNSKSSMTVQTLTRLALLGAVAMVLGWVDSLIPLPYGVKLGLANMVMLYSLYLLDLPSTFILMVLKVGLSVLTPNGMSRLAYSAAGALLSLLMMLLVKTVSRNKISIIGVSVVGATFHNIGQMLVASVVFGILPIIAYSPLLLSVGIGVGVAMGIVGRYAIQALGATGVGNPQGKIPEPKGDGK